MLERIRRFQSELLEIPHEVLVLQLTALFFLFRGFSGLGIWEVVLEIVCLVMLLSRTMLRWSGGWLLLFFIGVLVLTVDRASIDNHKYLMTYWLLACGLSLRCSDARKLMAWNGGLLLGLTFVFAVFWKIYPGELADNSFFTYTYLTDSRFFPVSQVVGGMTNVQIQQNQEIVRIWENLSVSDVTARLFSTDALTNFAFFTSYWTLFIEGLIALGFALFFWRKLEGFRDYILLIFVCTTYPIAPVDRFGILLTILGFAQCPIDRPKLRLAYVYVFLFLQFTRASDFYNRLMLAILGSQ